MKTILSALVCTVVLSSGSLALAQQDEHHEGKGGVMRHGGVCRDDMKKYCGDVKMGDHEAMKKCMDSNQDKFSEACKAEHAKMKGMMDEFMAACKSDMETLCKDVKKGDHRAMHECMEKNESKLSDKCKAVHEKHEEHMKEMHGKGHGKGHDEKHEEKKD